MYYNRANSVPFNEQVHMLISNIKCWIFKKLWNESLLFMTSKKSGPLFTFGNRHLLPVYSGFVTTNCFPLLFVLTKNAIKIYPPGEKNLLRGLHHLCHG